MFADQTQHLDPTQDERPGSGAGQSDPPVTQSFSIFVDTGGTFTDGVILTSDGNYASTKVPTTPQNLILCLIRLLERLAEMQGLEVSELLARTDTLAYATTKGTNTLIQRSGPRMGLITTAGFEDVERRRRSRGKADGLSWQEVKHSNRIRKPEPLVPRTMIEGVVERVDSLGEVVIPLSEDSVRTAVQRLIDRGAEGFVVNLIWGPRYPRHEERIREIIYEQLPESNLGSVPIVLGSELSPTRGEYGRGESALVCGYLHREMIDFVREFDERLRSLGYRRPVMLVQNNGGVARPLKTSAIRLWNSGPVAGTAGGSFIAETYGLENVALLDMGGTSCDVAVYHDGAWDSSFDPVADRFRLSLQIIDVQTIGAGGGSIAKYEPDLDQLSVGPESAEAMPGPVAYGLGGVDPTVTDADLALGYINPAGFLGGRMELFPEEAAEAIRRKIAEPTGRELADAALAIRKIVDGQMASLLYRQISMRGFDPREFTLLAYGGAGPIHACDVARDLGIKRIMVFPFSGEFCAFGAACSDVIHQYHVAQRIGLYSFAEQQYLSDVDQLNTALESLENSARRDFEAEGLESDEVQFDYEFAMRFGRQLGDFVVSVPFQRVSDEDDVRAICGLFVERYNEFFGAAAAYIEAGIEIKAITLHARLIRPRPTFSAPQPSLEPPAPHATRNVRFSVSDDWIETPIYAEASLGSSSVIEGPAIVERVDTAALVPPDARYEKDSYGNGVITWV